MNRYLGKSTGKDCDLSKIVMRFDSINRNKDIDQCWGMTYEADSGIQYYNCFDEPCRIYSQFVHSSEFKPILRRLSSMTEEEAKTFICSTDETLRITKIGPGGISYVGEQTDFIDTIFFSAIDPSRFNWLLKNSFDLFGFIESGLAIDAATLNLESKEN
jgi:hypothetical protein